MQAIVLENSIFGSYIKSTGYEWVKMKWICAMQCTFCDDLRKEN